MTQTGAIKELERLKEHYSEDLDMYSMGIWKGLKMAIEVLNNEESYP